MLRLIKDKVEDVHFKTQISKHLMLRLIPLTITFPNGSVVISKHLMLRLIWQTELLCPPLLLFQNILCYG